MVWHAERRTGLVLAAIAAALAVSPAASARSHAAAASACPSCGHNLIQNPGAETGKGANGDTVVTVPDWKQTAGFTAALYSWSGGDLSAKTPGPKDRGKNYFYGGPSSAQSTGTQVIAVAPGGISSGTVDYALSGWLGGFDSQADYAVLRLTFEDASGKAIATTQIGPVTETQRKGASELLYRSDTGTVPAATEQIKVELIMVRKSGSDDDGLADNLSLVLTST